MKFYDIYVGQRMSCSPMVACTDFVGRVFAFSKNHAYKRANKLIVRKGIECDGMAVC